MTESVALHTNGESLTLQCNEHPLDMYIAHFTSKEWANQRSILCTMKPVEIEMEFAINFLVSPVSCIYAPKM